MKTFNLAVLIFLTVHIAAAQSAYEKSMKAAMEQLFAQNRTKEDLISVANKFDRISQAEKDKWQPVYYASLAYSWLATEEETLEQKDARIDQSRKLIEEGLVRSPGNVEFVTMQGYSDMLSLSFDAGTRGQSMSTRVFSTFGRAMKMDPQNPRAQMFMAQMQYGTAQFFGQDTAPVCELFKSALSSFNNTKETGDFSPTWGKAMAEQMVKNCEEGAKPDN